MPKIFSESDRDNIRDTLLANGRKALEKSSYKNISVADIAAETGIAKGTFYNFFTSKEAFFYEIMINIRDENRLAIINTMKEPTKENVYKLFYERYTTAKTVYDYFSPEEMKIIFRRLPHKQNEADENSIQLAKQLISVCTDRKDINAEVVINLMNIAATAAANRDFLLADSYDETVSVIAKSITDYIFDK
ncbi:MAG: TetR/AcrR family transcriptional regulator [Oscillospiraceae bacterium]|nr:TetR/AcrR family transcriptional regulator [Oscillospiraceae bacterium]